MRIPLYQVDAFTSRLFGGNPAAVCPLTEWLPDETMQAIAAENNLAETAFFVAQGESYLLRWFTPAVEVELCGHATLASGYVVTHILRPEQRSVRFDTLKAGPLEFTRDGVVQGAVESSNVDPVREMTRLIEVTRAFDGVAAQTSQSEGSLQDAIKTLGSAA